MSKVHTVDMSAIGEGPGHGLVAVENPEIVVDRAGRDSLIAQLLRQRQNLTNKKNAFYYGEAIQLKEISRSTSGNNESITSSREDSLASVALTSRQYMPEPFAAALARNGMNQNDSMEKNTPGDSKHPQLARVSHAKLGVAKSNDGFSSDSALRRSVSIDSNNSNSSDKAKSLNDLRAIKRETLVSKAVTDSDKLREDTAVAQEKSKLKKMKEQKQKEAVKARMIKLLAERKQLPSDSHSPNSCEASSLASSPRSTTRSDIGTAPSSPMFKQYENKLEQLEDQMLLVAVEKLKNIHRTKSSPLHT